MGIEYRVDLREGVVWTTAVGVVGADEVLSVLAMQLAEPQLPDPYRELLDATGVDRLHFTAAAARKLVSLAAADRQRPAGQIAVLTHSDFIFGVARMVQTLGELIRGRFQVRVFRVRAEALTWLGLPRDRAPAIDSEITTASAGPAPP